MEEFKDACQGLDIEDIDRVCNLLKTFAATKPK